MRIDAGCFEIGMAQYGRDEGDWPHGRKADTLDGRN
jgi:hypothetical protein